MWHGRFSGSPGKLAQAYSESVSLDWQLYAHDIAGSIAHAAALAQAGVLTADELSQIESGLRTIEAEIAGGDFAWDVTFEDVHMNIEAALTKRIGAAGAKLHTARSRNDQVALDLRLYVRAEAAEIHRLLRQLQGVLLDLAERHQEVIMPGYTHLQRAQPVPFAHYLLGFIETLERDFDRTRDCARRADVLPLGSGAIAGSTIVLDRELIARRLGFSAISQNSVDGVSDRDFVCDCLFACAMIGLHLARLSEDLILWSTSEFNFLSFSDAFSTGSSLMPQKKNPDMAELTRGKSGRMIGNLVSILTTLKGLPTSYNRDLQEDKRPLFDSVATTKAALEVVAGMLREIEVHPSEMEAAAADPNLLATDVAEALVKRGLPFRDAHEVVGKLVAVAGRARVPLNELSVADMQQIHPMLDGTIGELFDVRRSLAQRTATGAPSPANLAMQLARWRSTLDRERSG